MKPLPFFLCLTFFLHIAGYATAGQPVSSIRGIILDADTRIPLIGVSIVLAGSDPMIGTVSDTIGAFRFKNLPVGRYDLNVYYMGYEPWRVNNILLTSGKEEVVRVELTESLIELEEVTIRASFIKNRKRSTHTIELDIQNLGNRLNIMGAYYDPEEDMIDTWTQMGIIPTINYRIEF